MLRFVQQLYGDFGHCRRSIVVGHSQNLKAALLKLWAHSADASFGRLGVGGGGFGLDGMGGGLGKRGSKSVSSQREVIKQRAFGSVQSELRRLNSGGTVGSWYFEVAVLVEWGALG